jgi:uncharacterized RDD family membrane protein YckC
VYAGVGIRFLALVLDLIPLLIIAGVVFGPVMGDFMTTIIAAMPARPSVGRDIGPELQVAMSEAMTAAVPGFLRATTLFQLGGLLYVAGSWLAFSRSPGMAVVGIRIVREEDGGRLTFGRVAVRYGGYLLSAVPLLLGFAWALFDNRKQAWHDKLAGTVVVRPIPQVAQRDLPWAGPFVAAQQPAALAPAPPPAPDETLPAAADAPPVPSAIEPPARKRPSIGAIIEAAWETYRRSPLDLLASMAAVFVPAVVVLLPLTALYLVVSQDQAVLSFQLIGEAFNFTGDAESYSQLLEYNRRILASSAPAVLIGSLFIFVSALTASLLVGATAAAVDDDGSIRPGGDVTRTVIRRVPALLPLGVTAGLLLGLEVILLGVPALTASSASAALVDPREALDPFPFGTGLSALLSLAIVPISVYLSAIWFLAVVCVVREGLGVAAALRRAWQLSRHRMRWLIGLSVASALAAYAVLGPIGLLPVGLLAEQYIGGARLPVALEVITIGIASLLAIPLFGLIYVAAYRAARNDAAGMDVATDRAPGSDPSPVGSTP